MRVGGSLAGRTVLTTSLLLPIGAAAPHPAPDATPRPQTVVVRMVDFAFEPATATVRPGDTVRFLQATATPHNVESRDAPAGAVLGAATLPAVTTRAVVGGDAPPPRMGPYLMTEGAVYHVVIGETFTEGTYAIVCTPHELMGMKGELVVSSTEETPGDGSGPS